MWLHAADIWAKNLPEKVWAVLYEQMGEGNKKSLASYGLGRDWWIAMEVFSMADYAKTTGL